MVLERSDFEKRCPSFYTDHPKYDVSDKYTFINTAAIIRMLWGMGWLPVDCRESRALDKSNIGYQKHMIRLAHKDYDGNGERVELVFVGSHNRSALLSFLASIWRKVCDNGLISQTGDLGSFKIRHIGDIEDQVKKAVLGITGTASQLAEKVSQFKEVPLSPEEQRILATTAHSYIYQDPQSAPIPPSSLLTPRRNNDSYGGDFYKRGEDRPKEDLWTTFNVIQENTMKGGLRGLNRSGKKTKTRKIQSIDKDIRLNTALWAMAEEMAELKRVS